MNFVELKDEQRESFARDGFLIVKKVLEPDMLKRLLEAGDRLAEPFLSKPEVPNKTEYNHLDLRPGLLEEPALLELVCHAPTVSLLVQILGPNIHLHSTSLTYKRPTDPTAAKFRRGWHRDIGVPRDLGHVGLPRVGTKICYCLTDFHEPDSGMTLFARGTHLRTAPLVIPDGEVDPVGGDVVDLPLDAGDALFFENRIFHTAAPNKSHRVSKVLIYGYAYRWMKQEVYLDPPDPRHIAGADLLTRQLLGGYRDVDTKPWAMREWARSHGVLPPPVLWDVETLTPQEEQS